MRYPKSIQSLIDHFSKLPSVGPKTAERYVFYLLRQPADSLQAFAQAIAELKEKTAVCQTCLSIAEASPCSICSDARRDKSTVCLVADTRDMIAIEASKEYQGLYFILGGVINTIEGVKPEQLNIGRLTARLNKNSIKEIILAFNPDVEGETTSMYMNKILKPFKLKVTRLAKGLPMGADLEYADGITLSNALEYRNQI